MSPSPTQRRPHSVGDEDRGFFDMSFKPSQATYHFVWRKNIPALRERVKTFWAQNDRMPHSDEIEQRLDELVNVATLRNDVVAVSSAAPKTFLREDLSFAFYRTSVGAEYRKSGMSNMMLNVAWVHMTQWSIDNPEAQLKGMGWVYENPVYDNRVVPQRPNGFNLMGYTDNKRPIYLKWFQHATI